ncbi:hypothetical protein [Streptomyces microflavus]|uniref:DNA polymerase III subunit beta n=1 Tax=Streptomyces microflavus TaxID=1919 RepID=UPI002E357FEC|nr:hypothetical protein [Streptomyces microflavus]
MRFTAAQSELAEATKWVERGLPRNPLYPVMMTMRFEALGGRLQITGWDGDTALRATVDADIETEGAALLPGTFLAGVVSGLRKNDVTIDCAKGSGVLTAPGVRVDIRPSDPGAWPTTPKAPAVAGVVDGKAFIKALLRVKPAAAKAAESQVNDLSGIGSVRLKASDGVLQLATTDRFRIAYATIPWEPQTELGDAFAVVSTDALEQARALAKGPVSLSLPTDGIGTAGIGGSGRQVVTKLTMPKSFPNIDRAELRQVVATTHIDAGELIDAIRTVSMVNTAITRPVWLRFDGQTVAVSATDLDSAEVRIDAELTGEQGALEIPFRGHFLTDGLSQVEGIARIDFSGPKSQAQITSPGDDSYRYIVLPIGDPSKATGAS